MGFLLRICSVSATRHEQIISLISCVCQLRVLNICGVLSAQADDKVFTQNCLPINL